MISIKGLHSNLKQIFKKNIYPQLEDFQLCFKKLIIQLNEYFLTLVLFSNINKSGALAHQNIVILVLKVLMDLVSRVLIFFTFMIVHNERVEEMTQESSWSRRRETMSSKRKQEEGKGWTNEKDGRGGNGLCTKVGILLQRKIRF